MDTIPAFYFDRTKLDELALALRPQYLAAQPFRHVTVDDFLPPHILALLIKEFPAADDPQARWEKHGPGKTAASKTREGDKLATSDESTFGPFTRHFMAQLNSATFLSFVEKLTGIRGLLVDPGYGACGLHSTGAGGRLMIHTDFTRHSVANRRLHQILNGIIYLNRTGGTSTGDTSSCGTPIASPRRPSSRSPIASSFSRPGANLCTVIPGRSRRRPVAGATPGRLLLRDRSPAG